MQLKLKHSRELLRNIFVCTSINCVMIELSVARFIKFMTEFEIVRRRRSEFANNASSVKFIALQLLRISVNGKLSPCVCDDPCSLIRRLRPIDNSAQSIAWQAVVRNWIEADRTELRFDA